MYRPGWGIGETLRQRRRELGLTLPQLSRRSGIHVTNIARIETGRRRATCELLIRLAEPLHFLPVELLTLAGY